MTILLTLEALDEGRVSAQDQVTVSPCAASMGGSQAFLDAGERYPLGELLKTVIVASANDSAVAIAEHLAGAEEAFVKRMNGARRRAWPPKHALRQLHRPARARSLYHRAGRGEAERAARSASAVLPLLDDLDG